MNVTLDSLPNPHLVFRVHCGNNVGQTAEVLGLKIKCISQITGHSTMIFSEVFIEGSDIQHIRDIFVDKQC